VAQTLGRRVDVYRRNPDTNDIGYSTAIPLEAGPDNLSIDDEGRLWIGAHPQMIPFLRWASDAADHAPSQALMVSTGPNGEFRVRNVMTTRGEQLSGVSVAVWFDGRLALGSVFDPQFRICPYDPDQAK
jgi:hypothetical protein